MNDTNKRFNNNREDDVKAKDGARVEDGEIDNMSYKYIYHKYKDLINNIFKYGLKKKDLHLMGIDNRIMGLKILSVDI